MIVTVRQANLSVTEIGLAVGFSSAQHISTVFARYTGCRQLTFGLGVKPTMPPPLPNSAAILSMNLKTALLITNDLRILMFKCASAYLFGEVSLSLCRPPPGAITRRPDLVHSENCWF